MSVATEAREAPLASLPARDLVIRAHAPALAVALGSIERTARGAGLPAMQSVRIACLPGDRHILLTTSNLDIWQSHSVAADIQGIAPDAPTEERTLVLGSIETLAPWIASVATGSAADIEIRHEIGAARARVTCGRACVWVAVHPAESYPDAPGSDEGPPAGGWTVQVSPSYLLRLIGAAAPFVSRDTSRRHQLGLALQPVIEGGTGQEASGALRAVATDTHSLCVQCMPLLCVLEGEGGEGQIALLHANSGAISELRAMAQSLVAASSPSRAGRGAGDGKQAMDGAMRDAISLRYSPGTRTLAVWQGAKSLVARLSESKFVPWERVVPSPRASNATLLLDTQALEAALRRVSLAAAGRMDRISLSWLAGGPAVPELRLEASSASGHASEAVAASVTGESGEICIASALLLRALASCPTEGVNLHYQGPLRPMLFTPSGDTRPGCEGAEDWRSVVMPMAPA